MLTQNRLHELFVYDQKSGLFYRKVNCGNVSAGESAGWLHHSGYHCIKIDYIIYFAHRLAWLYMYGKFPDNLIDHKNGVKNCNAILNLREATSSQNQQNRKLNKNNRSGFRGVFLDKNSGKWRAKIKLKNRQIYLGLFDTPIAASCAWEKMAKLHFGDFFHQGFTPC